MVLVDERRQSTRYNLNWPVCVWHEPTQRFYEGRSANISGTGALVRLPLSAPIRKDETLELNFPSPEESPAADGAAKRFNCEVVRINRGSSILDAVQQVALHFV